MNCKPGDLAIYRACNPENDGLLVEVIRPFDDNDLDGRLNSDWRGHFPWLCRSLGRPIVYRRVIGTQFSLLVGPLPDAQLSPLPGEDAVDEVLQKLGKPEGVEA